MTNIFYGKANNGKLNFDNNKALFDYLSSVEGKKLVIQIDRERSKRTLNQNAYYWLYLRLIANETGHTEDELHQLFKRLFLPPVFMTILGVTIKVPRTTTNLAKHEFSEYLDKICARTKISLPPIKEATDYLGEYPTEELEPKF